MKEYLDVQGGKHLTNKMKTYVDDKVKNLPAGGTGTVDLTNYYTKKETDDLLKNITGGGTGAAGKDGVGISSIKLENYELIVTLTDGTEHNLGNVRGEKGDKGATGAKGADGRNGIDGVDGKDGAKGTDGVSPTVAITETTNGHTVAITDVNGTQSFEVLNGKDGASGGSSGGGGTAITYAYDTEIATGETWIDGKPIYLKVFHVDALKTAPEVITYSNYFTDIPSFASTFVSTETVWRYPDNNNGTFTGSVVQAFSSVYGTSTASVTNAIKDMLSRTAWTKIYQNSSNFGITVTGGNNMAFFECDIFVKYTKL